MHGGVPFVSVSTPQGMLGIHLCSLLLCSHNALVPSWTDLGFSEQRWGRRADPLCPPVLRVLELQELRAGTDWKAEFSLRGKGKPRVEPACAQPHAPGDTDLSPCKDGGPVVRLSTFIAEVLGLIPGWGTKIPQAKPCSMVKTKTNQNNPTRWQRKTVTLHRNTSKFLDSLNSIQGPLGLGGRPQTGAPGN